MSKQLVFGTFIGLLLTAAVGYYFFVSKAIPPPAGALHKAGVEAEPINLPTIEIAEDYSLNFTGREDLIAHAKSLHPFLTPEAWDSSLKLDQLQQPLTSPRMTRRCAGLQATSGIALSKSTIDSIKQGKQNIITIATASPKCFVRESSLALVYDDIFENKVAYPLAGKLKIERILESRVDFIPDSFFAALKISRDDFSLLYSLGNVNATAQDSVFTLLVSYDPNSPNLEQDSLPTFAAGAEVISVQEVLSQITQLTPDQRQKLTIVDTREPKYFMSSVTVFPSFKMINAPFIPSNPMQSRFRPDFPLSALSGSKVDLSQIPTEAEIPLILIGHDKHDAGPLWVLRELRLRPHRGMAILADGFASIQPPKTKK